MDYKRYHTFCVVRAKERLCRPSRWRPAPLLVALAGRQLHRFPAILTAQFQPDGALDLPEDYIIWQSAARFVIGNNLRLLIDFSRKVFLGKVPGLSSLLD